MNSLWMVLVPFGARNLHAEEASQLHSKQAITLVRFDSNSLRGYLLCFPASERTQIDVILHR